MPWIATLVRERKRAERRKGERGESEDAAPPEVVWLALDPLDNTVIRFWSSVIAALRTVVPEIGQTALALLHAAETSPLSIILRHLLSEVELSGRKLLLILDDYHLISEQSIIDSMLFLLDHIPANLHLVLSTRTDPELPLTRLRVRSQLVEIRDRDLRFTEEETARFLREGMGLPLDTAEVAILYQRTEGWIAGLQLAALAMRKRADLSTYIKDFAGSYRYLQDYVQQEILARLPVSVQDFLLQTSILSRMEARLCQAITQGKSQQASQQMLEELERANLFLVPLDEQRQWYRYHDLFREILSARLRAAQPEIEPVLHQRAARAYEAAGELREAIAHALAAFDYPYAADLMEKAAPRCWLNGEAEIVQAWILSLPDAILYVHTRLALNAALRFFNAVNVSTETPYISMRVQVEQTIARIEGLLRCWQEPALSGAEVALIERRLRLLRALFEARGLLFHDNQERLRQVALEMEALPPDEEASWNMIPLSLTVWLTSLLQLDGALLVPRLLSAKQMMEAGDPLVRVRVRTWLAASYIQAGQLHLARQECLEGLSLVEQTCGRTIWSGYLHYSLSSICYAQNRLEEAADWLQRSLRCAQDWHQVALLVLGMRAQARLGLACGDLQTAQQVLHQLEALVEQEGAAHGARWVREIQLSVWLAQGNLAEASAWEAQAPYPLNVSGPVRREELLMRVRVLLAQQRYPQVVERLQCWSQHLDRPGDIPTALEWMALSVVALHCTDKRKQMIHIAARLLSLTEPEDNIRVYLDAGPLIKQALNSLLELSSSDDAGAAVPPLGDAISMLHVTRILSAFEQSALPSLSPQPRLALDLPPGARRCFEEQRQASAYDACSASFPNKEVLPAQRELLSAREQRVLRLLVAGQTSAEMAQALVVSLNTVKTQVSSVYCKLGVHRRAEAIAAAQRLHLI